MRIGSWEKVIKNIYLLTVFYNVYALRRIFNERQSNYICIFIVAESGKNKFQVETEGIYLPLLVDNTALCIQITTCKLYEKTINKSARLKKYAFNEQKHNNILIKSQKRENINLVRIIIIIIIA